MAMNGSLERRSREVVRDELDRTLENYAKREYVTKEIGALEVRLMKWTIGIVLGVVTISVAIAVLIERLID